jgi:pimeloyl-ACP methyl ester carboxylesterase
VLLWPALAPLAANRQLIFFDQRGRGESEAPADPLSARIEHDADDVAALRAALGFTHWDALGHSWGGGIGLLAAERDRVGIRRLVLVDAVGPDGTWMRDVYQRALERLGPSDRATLQRIDVSRLATPDPAIHSAYSRALHPAWFADPELASAFTLPRSGSVTGSAVACRLHRDGYDWRGTVRAVTANTLVMHGERDLLPPRVAHEIAALIPHARLELIPGGHMPYWESPETFFKTVDAFLAAR